MIRNIIFAFVAIFTFTQCSKKTEDLVSLKAERDRISAMDWRSAAPGPSEARAINMGDYHSFTLDNGLRVIVVENNKLPRVSYQISLNNDPVNEGEEVGYVSFAGELITKGTATRTKAEIDEAIDFIGASMSASGKGMFGSSLKKHSDELLSLMTDVLYNPSFPADEFEKLKTQTRSGLATVKTDPNAMASNVAQVLNYGTDHPYGQVQTETGVDKITLERCKGYFNTYFRPNNAFLVIVGDISTKEAEETAKKHFGGWQRGEIPASTMPEVKESSKRKVAFVHREGAVQSLINITYPVDLKPGDEDIVPANIMNSILGGGIFSGRLMQNLREDKAYTYGARSRLSSDQFIGSFSASANVGNVVTDSAVHEFLYEMGRIVTEMVSDGELEIAKNGAAGGYARSLESPQTIASYALNTFKYNLPQDYYATYLSRLEKVDKVAVMKAAQKYIRPDNAYIVIAGNKDEVADKLIRFDADRQITFYDAFGNVITYDAVALPTDVTAEKVIENYIIAIGGKENLNEVQSMVVEMTLNLMGQQAGMKSSYMKPNMYRSEMSMQGMVMQTQIFDGEKASISGMGQQQSIGPDDEGFEVLKNQAYMFVQLNYLMDNGYKLELKSIESIDGVNCYKIEVSSPGGAKSSEYYSVEDHLLIQVSMTQDMGEQVNIVNTTYGDYRQIGNIKYPHSLTITGAAPFPLNLKTEKVEINTALDESVFSIE
jgi:zinc protease